MLARKLEGLWVFSVIWLSRDKPRDLEEAQEDRTKSRHDAKAAFQQPISRQTILLSREKEFIKGPIQIYYIGYLGRINSLLIVIDSSRLLVIGMRHEYGID